MATRLAPTEAEKRTHAPVRSLCASLPSTTALVPCGNKQMLPRAWKGVIARLWYVMAAFNLLITWTAKEDYAFSCARVNAGFGDVL